MMPIDGIINGTNGIINQNRGEESMNAVIYARYSSDSQREESIEGQIRECTEYAKRNGITILGTYIDRALSARSADRPEFQRMIKDAEKELFEIALVCLAISSAIRLQMLRSTPSTAAPMAFLIAFALEEP